MCVWWGLGLLARFTYPIMFCFNVLCNTFLCMVSLFDGWGGVIIFLRAKNVMLIINRCHQIYSVDSMSVAESYFPKMLHFSIASVTDFTKPSLVLSATFLRHNSFIFYRFFCGRMGWTFSQNAPHPPHTPFQTLIAHPITYNSIQNFRKTIHIAWDGISCRCKVRFSAKNYWLSFVDWDFYPQLVCVSPSSLLNGCFSFRCWLVCVPLLSVLSCRYRECDFH